MLLLSACLEHGRGASLYGLETEKSKTPAVEKGKNEKKKQQNQPCVSLTLNAQRRFCEIKSTSDTKPNCTTGLPENVLEFRKCLAHVVSWRDCKEKSG